MKSIFKKFLVAALLAAAVSACGLTAMAAEDGVVKQDIDSVLAMAKPVPEDRDLGEIFQDKLLEGRDINGLSESGLPAATVEHLRNIGFPVDDVKREEKYQDLFYGTGDIYTQYSVDSEHRFRVNEDGKVFDIFNAGADILAPDWDYQFDTTEEQYRATGEKVKAMLGLDENYKLVYTEGFSNDYWSMNYRRVLPNGLDNVYDGVNVTVARKNCSVAFLHYFDLPANTLEAEITEEEALAAAQPVIDRLKTKKVSSVKLRYVQPNFYWEDKYYEDVDFIRLAYEIKLNKGQYLVYVDAVTGEVIGGDMAIGIFEDEAETDENGFTDTCKHWAASAIDYVVSNGIFNGTSESKFEPNAKMNRAMLVTALWRLEGRPLTKYAGGFRDVAAGSWYSDAVDWAAEKGIVQGYDEKTFGVADNLTREQLAAILYRYGVYKKYDVKQCGTLANFLDAHKIEPYAKANMRWALGAGIITGRTADTLAPQGECTRAEVAVMLQRFREKYSK